MALNGVSLLLLLLACCLVPTIARNLDISQKSNREFSNSEEGTKARSAGLLVIEKQEPFAGAGHAKEVSISSVRTEEMSLPSLSYVEGTSVSHDNVMSLKSLAHTEDILLHDSELVLHDDDDTIPSLLDQNGLPIGLLPSSVASYSVTDDGEFTVSLQNACYVKFDYEVYYAQTITGKLSYGTITDLSGIQAKEAFFWVPVTGIRTDIPSSEYIYFNVGPISKKLSISQFQTIPVCKGKAMASALA